MEIEDEQVLRFVMKILILEDDQIKLKAVREAIADMGVDAELTEVGNWLDYSKQVNSKVFDLILLDLLVPRSPRDPKVEDHCTQLVETTRGFDSKSFRTPAIVLTKYLAQSEEFFRELNKVDITAISFDDEGTWKPALEMKVRAAEPKAQFEFLIICALSKEVMAFESEVEFFGPLKTIAGLSCREVVVKGFKGAIVQMPRMGLVSGAVISAYAIERFSPKLICMSGICGGVPGESLIYDVLITDVCHQHDAGKWSNAGFRSEHYDNQLKTSVRNRIEELVNDEQTKARVSAGLVLAQSEYPKGMEKFDLRLRLTPTSSGSAVIAEQGKTASLTGDQRKLAGFDMEVFSVFEASRLNSAEPLVFAAKSVVDDGDENKGDNFHRIGCLLSARFVVSVIESGVSNLYTPPTKPM